MLHLPLKLDLYWKVGEVHTSSLLPLPLPVISTIKIDHYLFVHVADRLQHSDDYCELLGG